MSIARPNTRYQCHNCHIVAAVVAAVDNRRNSSGNSGMLAAGLPVHSPAVVYNQFAGSPWPPGILGLVVVLAVGCTGAILLLLWRVRCLSSVLHLLLVVILLVARSLLLTGLLVLTV